jgi:hypothetical protein
VWASVDGDVIFLCQDGQTSHSGSNEFVFLFTDAFGMIVRAVENDQTRGRNIGQRKSKLIESAINGFHERYGKVGTRSSLFGNARFVENIQSKRLRV